MNKLALDAFLQNALIEDIGFGDITSEALFSENDCSEGWLIAKQDLVLAGIDIFSRVFALLDERVKIAPCKAEGSYVTNGEKFAMIEGPTRSVLSGERVALNLLQRLSGIATETRRCVEAVGNYGAVIVDTRKTTPGLRMLEKYAVTVGGGKNHRFGLDSLVMLKDNHIKASGGIVPAVQKARSVVSPFVKIEVEVESLEQVNEAIAAKADIIMLDNMPLVMVRESVKVINRQAVVEVSGNVTVERVAELAAAGVDVISSGALTHSVKAADISLRLK